MKRVGLSINDIHLEEIIKDNIGWNAIAFLAPDSIPCKHFLPEFKMFANIVKKTVFCGVLDVEENPTITQKCGVIAVPTTLLFRDGKELARYEGPYSCEAILERARSVMASKK